MKMKKVIAGIISAAMLMNISGSSFVSYAAENSVVEVTDEKNQQEIIAPEEANTFQVELNELLAEKAHYYETLVELTDESRTKFLESLTAENAYQFLIYSKYAFIEELMKYKNETELKQSDMERLSSYVDIYISIAEISLKKEIDNEKIPELEKEVYEVVISKLNPDALEGMKNFETYAAYLQTLTDLDIKEVLEKLNALSDTDPEHLQNQTKEFKKYVYAIYGFDSIEDETGNDIQKEEVPEEMSEEDVSNGNGEDIASDENAEELTASESGARAIATVYVDGYNGNDNNNGKYTSSPVKTLYRAYSLLKTTGGNISFVNPVTTSNTTYIRGTNYSDSANGTVTLNSGCRVELVRYRSNTTGCFINHTGNTTLKIDNITLNGYGYPSQMCFVSVKAGSISSTGAVYLNNGSSTSGWAGAVEIKSGLGQTFNNCRFQGNYSRGGAAIYADNGTINLTNCVFEGNKGSANTTDGGVVYFLGTSTGTITGCEFKNNSGFGLGSAINIWSSKQIRVVNTKFINNSARQHSGAISNPGGCPLIIEGCTFTGNVGPNLAGAVYSTGPLEIKNNSIFDGNSTSGYGGAVSATKNLTVDNSRFVNNKAAGTGGAIWASGILNVKNNSWFEGNTAKYGGAVYNKNTATIASSYIQNNTTAGAGAGIYAEGGLTITESIVRENKVTSITNAGGGICLFSSGNISNTDIYNNQAGHGGGLYLASNSTLSLDNVNIYDNTSVVKGGGIGVADGSGIVAMNNTSLSGNTAPKGEGVYSGGVLKIKGSTLVSDENDIYLPSNRFVTVDGSLTSTSEQIARITPDSYTLGRKVIEVNYDNKKASDEIDRFALTPSEEFVLRPGDYLFNDVLN